MKQFHMRDEGFLCEHCHQKVEPLKYTARDHCPYCLYSKHVDINPGDRANPCHGLLVPIELEPFKGRYKVVYQCQKCHQKHKNIIANDDTLEAMIAITNKQQLK